MRKQRGKVRKRKETAKTDKVREGRLQEGRQSGKQVGKVRGGRKRRRRGRDRRWNLRREGSEDKLEERFER